MYNCGDYLGVRTNKDFLRLLFFVLLYAAVQNVFSLCFTSSVSFQKFLHQWRTQICWRLPRRKAKGPICKSYVHWNAIGWKINLGRIWGTRKGNAINQWCADFIAFRYICISASWENAILSQVLEQTIPSFRQNIQWSTCVCATLSLTTRHWFITYRPHTRTYAYVANKAPSWTFWPQIKTL